MHLIDIRDTSSAVWIKSSRISYSNQPLNRILTPHNTIPTHHPRNLPDLENTTGKIYISCLTLSTDRYYPPENHLREFLNQVGWESAHLHPRELLPTYKEVLCFERYGGKGCLIAWLLNVYRWGRSPIIYKDVLLYLEKGNRPSRTAELPPDEHDTWIPTLCAQ